MELDGSSGEGGGQILRTALALAMCTGRPLALTNIRAQRPKPGLMRQHLTCVQAAAAVCSATVEGAVAGSQTLRFVPAAVRAGDYAFNVGSAGSCTLVLQTVLPALMGAAGPSRVTLGGGTHNPMAPPFHFLARSFAPLLRRLGVGLDLELRRHGFYPAGGGEIVASIRPAAAGLDAFDLVLRGAAIEEFAECLNPGLRQSVATRELAVLRSALHWADGQLRTAALRNGEGPGNALMATLAHEQVCEVFTSFGARGISSEQVAHALVAEVQAFQTSSGALGPHLADQWMLPLALAVAGGGRDAQFTCSALTGHARTNAGVIERFLPVRFTLAQESTACRVHLASTAVR